MAKVDSLTHDPAVLRMQSNNQPFTSQKIQPCLAESSMPAACS